MKLGKSDYLISAKKKLKIKFSLSCFCFSFFLCLPAASQTAESIGEAAEHEAKSSSYRLISSEIESVEEFESKVSESIRQDAEKSINSKLDKMKARSNIVVSALGFIGIPYKWGGSDSTTGFDCSGFVKLLYENSLGFLLPRKAQQQAKATHEIGRSDLIPGDLVFFNTMKKSFSHVGVYVGQGRFVHAPRAGALVRVDDIENSYWSRRFDGARRVIPQ